MSRILIGLDIGAQTIKAVQIQTDKNKRSLLAAGFIPTPVASLTTISQKDEQAVGNSINRLVHEMKVTTNEVNVSLPSSKVITRVINVPLMSDNELASSIQWEAEQYIPWQLSKMKIDYAIIEKDPASQKMKVLLVAAPTELIEKYMRIIQFAGLTIQAIETEVLAVGRCVVNSFPNVDNMLLLTMGATTTEIALTRKKDLVYTKSYPIGGNTFTRSIAEDLGFEAVQAEEYKKTYGLEEDKLEGKIAKIMAPYFSNIIAEMEKTVAFFKEQYPSEEVNTVIVSGGSAKLPGLVFAITKTLGIDSQVNNPFVNIYVDPKVLPIITPDAPIYTASVGLALKEV